MDNNYISFYLRNNRLHIFVDTLRGIGSPKFICFLVEENGQTLIMAPYDKKDFHSHRVPPGVYTGTRGLELNSYRLCRILTKLHNWNANQSYRVPGAINANQNYAIFYLDKAEMIGH